jgi:hypothetical protein
METGQSSTHDRAERLYDEAKIYQDNGEYEEAEQPGRQPVSGSSLLTDGTQRKAGGGLGGLLGAVGGAVLSALTKRSEEPVNQQLQDLQIQDPSLRRQKDQRIVGAGSRKEQPIEANQSTMRDQADRLCKEAMICQSKREYDKAEQLFLKSAKISKELEDQGRLAISLERLAQIATSRGEADRARPMFEQSAAIYQKLAEGAKAQGHDGAAQQLDKRTRNIHLALRNLPVIEEPAIDPPPKPTSRQTETLFGTLDTTNCGDYMFSLYTVQLFVSRLGTAGEVGGGEYNIDALPMHQWRALMGQGGSLLPIVVYRDHGAITVQVGNVPVEEVPCVYPKH